MTLSYRYERRKEDLQKTGFKIKILIENWEELRPIRSLIEDVLKLARKKCHMDNLHRYTTRSVKNYFSLAVFLTEKVTAFHIMT